MEFPKLGEHCSEPTCNKLDFLPVNCDACSKTFCSSHMKYDQHRCPNAKSKDAQVPICPLCNAPVPTPRNQPPDIAVGEHIDKQCESDRAKATRKKRCAAQGCKVKDLILLPCTECQSNFCVPHRFPQDHKCQGKRGAALKAAEKRMQQTSRPTAPNSNLRNRIQGNLSEDEALARALAQSMQDSQPPRPQAQRAGVPSGSSNDRCRVS